MSSASASSDSIQRIGVLGAGQMGAAAAVMFQRAGFDVLLWTRQEEALQAAKGTMESVEAFLNEHFGTP
jgi:3-hydroxybutyryl-CoA dehydrogenase